MLNIGIWYKETIWQYLTLIRFFNGNWQLVIGLYLISLKLRFKQWWNKTCTQIDVDTYELHHIIKGKHVKVFVKLKYMPPTTTVINNRGENITEKAIPYLRCSFVSLKPKYINEAGLTICKDQPM